MESQLRDLDYSRWFLIAEDSGIDSPCGENLRNRIQQESGHAGLDPVHEAVRGDAAQEPMETRARGGEASKSADFLAASVLFAEAIDAFFRIGSTFFRVFRALAAAFFAYLLNGFCHSGSMIHLLFFAFAANMADCFRALHGLWFSSVSARSSPACSWPIAFMMG